MKKKLDTIPCKPTKFQKCKMNFILLILLWCLIVGTFQEKRAKGRKHMLRRRLRLLCKFKRNIFVAPTSFKLEARYNKDTDEKKIGIHKENKLLSF